MVGFIDEGIIRRSPRSLGAYIFDTQSHARNKYKYTNLTSAFDCGRILKIILETSQHLACLGEKLKKKIT